MTPLVREIAALSPDVATSCVWFDVGELPKNYDLDALVGSRLPFEQCAIVARSSWDNGKIVLLAVAGDDSPVLLTLRVLYPDRFVKVPTFAIVTEGSVGAFGVDDEEEAQESDIKQVMGIYAHFIAVTNPPGYRATSKASITNKRREAKGKPPLVYSWHTVIIEPPNGKRDTSGGAHATPRQHERRGHWRTCSNGKRVWVRNCLVGDPARGFVSKDYQAKRTLLEPT
jgi:hypothetical protein